MSKFSIENLPKEDFKALGLFKDDQLLLNQSCKDALLNGRVTPLMRLQDINVEGLGIKSLDAKISIQPKDDGTLGLYVHPIFKERVAHPNLTPEENEVFSRGGVLAKESSAYGKIVNFGNANYQFDEKNKPSFFIQLEKSNGEKSTIWGVDLERALKESRKEVGDNVQLEFKGKQNVDVQINGKWQQKERYTWEVNDVVEERKKAQTTIYQFDKETNSFVAVESDNVLVPEEVNGMPLTPEQKKKIKNGEIIEMPDGTSVQTAPAEGKNSFLQSNRKLLVASVLVDGGMSFALIKGIQLISQLSNRKKEQDQQYNKGYRDALLKVQADLERKSKEFPNNKEILNDINIVKTEFNRTATTNTYNDLDEKNVNDIKATVNDPELDDNAERLQNEDAADRKEKSVHVDDRVYSQKDDEQEERKTRKR